MTIEPWTLTNQWIRRNSVVTTCPALSQTSAGRSNSVFTHYTLFYHTTSTLSHASTHYHTLLPHYNTLPCLSHMRYCTLQNYTLHTTLLVAHCLKAHKMHKHPASTGSKSFPIPRGTHSFTWFCCILAWYSHIIRQIIRYIILYIILSFDCSFNQHLVSIGLTGFPILQNTLSFSQTAA